MKPIELAKQLMRLYAAHNKALYLVGGSVRDYLLLGDFSDFDFATPCLLQESVQLLKASTYDAFSARFGTLKTTYQGQPIEITTFRQEGGYRDFRHPDLIQFVDDLTLDAKRRDFTINAMYLDAEGNIIDPTGGRLDAKYRILRMIGDPVTRIQQDPVRLLRALRFVLQFKLTLEVELEKSIQSQQHLLAHISEARGIIELKKMALHASKQEIQALFDHHRIKINVEDYLEK